MFASKTPRDLNHDPYPFRFPGGRVGFADPKHAEPGDVFDPRPEFDHVQHNPPNPILVGFRERGADNVEQWLNATWMYSEFGGYTDWEHERSYFNAFVGASRAQTIHARRVFERLARLTEGAAS